MSIYETRYRTFGNLSEFFKSIILSVGRDSSVGIATRYGLEGPGIESRWGGGGEIFRIRPDLGQPGLPYNGYRVFPGGKVASSSAGIKERVELYLCSPFGPSWPVLG